jgi:hypothetical protein
MMKYKVNVTVKAEVSYTVEVEAASEAKAEDLATAMWREKTPDDFQVNRGYITEMEIDSIDNLTWECGSCEKEISYEESARNRGNCDKCEAEWKAELAMTTRKAGNA